MKGRVHLSVNSFAGSPVSKPQSSYWVPETLHSTKPHSDLSASYSSARYWVSLSRWWSSSQAKFQPAVLPGLWGVLAVQLYCCVALSLIDLQRFVKDWRSLIPLFEFLFSLVSRAGFCNISWSDFFITRLSLGRLNSFHLTNITFKKNKHFFLLFWTGICLHTLDMSLSAKAGIASLTRSQKVTHQFSWVTERPSSCVTCHGD